MRQFTSIGAKAKRAIRTENIFSERLVRAVYTVGEIVQYAPKVDANTFNLMRATVVSDVIENNVEELQQQNRDSQVAPPLIMRPSDPGMDIATQSTIAAGGVSQFSTHITGGQYMLPRGVRAAVFLTLGKISIVVCCARVFVLIHTKTFDIIL